MPKVPSFIRPKSIKPGDVFRPIKRLASTKISGTGGTITCTGGVVSSRISRELSHIQMLGTSDSSQYSEQQLKDFLTRINSFSEPRQIVCHGSDTAADFLALSNSGLLIDKQLTLFSAMDEGPIAPSLFSLYQHFHKDPGFSSIRRHLTFNNALLVGWTSGDVVCATLHFSPTKKVSNHPQRMLPFLNPYAATMFELHSTGLISRAIPSHLMPREPDIKDATIIASPRTTLTDWRDIFESDIEHIKVFGMGAGHINIRRNNRPEEFSKGELLSVVSRFSNPKHCMTASLERRLEQLSIQKPELFLLSTMKRQGRDISILGADGMPLKTTYEIGEILSCVTPWYDV